MNTAFLQGEDPEADLMGRTASAEQVAPPAAPATLAEQTTIGARRRRRDQAPRPAPRPASPPPPRPGAEKRWQRVNVYLEPKTQGHWMNRTRGRLLELDRGDIGLTEIVRLALDRLADQLNVSELVTEYDRRYGSQEDA